MLLRKDGLGVIEVSARFVMFCTQETVSNLGVWTALAVGAVEIGSPERRAAA
jgi:hypothetical protein